MVVFTNDGDELLFKTDAIWGSVVVSWLINTTEIKLYVALNDS